jgi:hypothetical protein
VTKKFFYEKIQASNNNVSAPATSKVTIDLKCKLKTTDISVFNFVESLTKVRNFFIWDYNVKEQNGFAIIF